MDQIPSVGAPNIVTLLGNSLARGVGKVVGVSRDRDLFCG